MSLIQLLTVCYWIFWLIFRSPTGAIREGQHSFVKMEQKLSDSRSYNRDGPSNAHSWTCPGCLAVGFLHWTMVIHFALVFPKVTVNNTAECKKNIYQSIL